MYFKLLGRYSWLTAACSTSSCTRTSSSCYSSSFSSNNSSNSIIISSSIVIYSQHTLGVLVQSHPCSPLAGALCSYKHQHCQQQATPQGRTFSRM
jgi:hypothetical protein